MTWSDTPDGQRIGLAWAWAQPVEQVLTVDQLPEWVERRTTVCGHVRELEPERCKMCRGTYRVIEAFSAGPSAVRIVPAR